MAQHERGPISPTLSEATELKAEVARVSALANQAHLAAVASLFMGGTGALDIAKRDALLEVLRRACLAPDEERASALNELRAIT